MTASNRSSRWARLGLLFALLPAALFCLGQATAPEEEAPPPIDLSTPRATVQTFFEAMGGVQAGNDERLSEAISCLFLDEEIPEEDRMTRGAEAAEQLYQVLDSIQFSLSDIAEEASGDNYVTKLGDAENPLELSLHRYEDGAWRFSSLNFEAAQIEEMEETVAKKEEGESAEEAPVFVESLKSPRVTMQTFLRGINETDGLTEADALTALDLSDINESVRADVGRDLAVQLKSAMDRIKLVEYNELPPESTGEAYSFFRSPEGRIVIDVIEDAETGEKAWKFTKATLENIESLYLAYKDKPLVEGLKPESEVDLPLSLQLRNWVHDNAGFLLEKNLYLQNWQWLGLFSVILVGMVISRLIGLLMILIVRRWTRMQKVRVKGKLEKDFVRPIRISLMAWFWLLGLTVLGLPADTLLYLRIAAKVVTALGAIWAAYRLIDVVGEVMLKKASRTDNKFDDLLVPIVTRSLKIFLVCMGIVLIVHQSGKDPATVLTGLGLGGLAFALAAKDVVANVFGSFTILLDRPFQIGDWVIIAGIEGTVESVGVRSTRIRTFYNSLITVPNSELISTSVDNMGKRRYRRIKTMIGIAYDTPPEKIEAFCEGIREMIRQHPYTRKDYFHCYFNQFDASSLGVLLYCFVEVPDWATELRERERLFLDIMRLAKRLEVEFAFPTQTLYMRQEEAPRHGSLDDTPEAFGRAQGRQVVRDSLGPDGTIPPPVATPTTGGRIEDAGDGD